VIATPAPTKSPVAASCGLCVEDNSISCSTNADCPLVPSEGTCTSPGGAETDGSPCLSNDDCLPNTGKQFSRGKCNNVGTVNSECDPNLCPPTNAPTKSVSVSEGLNADYFRYKCALSLRRPARARARGACTEHERYSSSLRVALPINLLGLRCLPLQTHR
jgi:hypothetical protein